MKNKKVKILLGITVSLIVCGGAFYKFHPHDFKMIESQEPTCTEQGIEKYTCWCGEEKTETLDAIGHNYTESIVEPTCTEEGQKTFNCEKCDDEYTETIEPLGHDYDAEGICTRCGEEDPIVTKKREEEEAAKRQAEEEAKRKAEEAKKQAEEEAKKKNSSATNGSQGNASNGDANKNQSGAQTQASSTEQSATLESLQNNPWGLPVIDSSAGESVCDAAHHFTGE